MRTLLLVLGALSFMACAETGNRIDVQPELAPKFDLSWDDTQDEDSDRLVVELTPKRWKEALIVGGVEVSKDSTVEIVVTSPFSATGRAVYLHDPRTGNSVPIEFAYGPVTPTPMFSDFAVVPEYSVDRQGMLLHILVGSKADKGVSVLVQQPPS